MDMVGQTDGFRQRQNIPFVSRRPIKSFFFAGGQNMNFLAFFFYFIDN
jgi:hypothetical protein